MRMPSPLKQYLSMTIKDPSKEETEEDLKNQHESTEHSPTSSIQTGHVEMLEGEQHCQG